MWRRIYLLLVAVRLYFALQPSYIHPDEHFQGPEIIAGDIFDWPSYKTWEFTSANPIRSIFPLWLLYAPPLTLLKWIWEGLGYGNVPPIAAFYVVRVTMFLLSFVLEDWALHELLPDRRRRATAIMLVASSYVTWTFQTHTFSNSIETLLVLWCIVLVLRIRDQPEHTMGKASCMLSFLCVLGTFNRITFPAFLLFPLLLLLPHLAIKPLRLPLMLLTAALTTLLAIAVDTTHYTSHPPSPLHPLTTAIFTPYNNLLYNATPSNLALHGLHPYHQHLLLNLPQLLGPAYLLLPTHTHTHTTDPLLPTALLAIALLSTLPHQEPRFLLPALPILLSTLRLPTSPRARTLFLTAWLAFNLPLAALFGLYHQAGVVPTQTFLAQHLNTPPPQLAAHAAHADADADVNIFWWKTYSPPRWLLDGALDPHAANTVTTTDLMGIPGQEMLSHLAAAAAAAPPCTSFSATAVTAAPPQQPRTLLVAPANRDVIAEASAQGGGLEFEELWRWRRHVGLDDLDFGGEGVAGTVEKVWGRRGVVVWEVRGGMRCVGDVGVGE